MGAIRRHSSSKGHFGTAGTDRAIVCVWGGGGGGGRRERAIEFYIKEKLDLAQDRGGGRASGNTARPHPLFEFDQRQEVILSHSKFAFSKVCVWGGGGGALKPCPAGPGTC